MIFSIRNTFIAIGLFCCTTGSFAQPQSTGNTTGTTAGQAAQTLAADETFRQSYVGIKVMTGAGDVLAAVNDEKTLVPASNMKLISTGAALFALGPEYRFSTEIAHDGHISEGTLHGNLYIVGGGDPTLGSKDTLATPLPLHSSNGKRP